MRSSKGLGTVALFLIVGLILTVSAWVFFIFFKIHVTSIAVDVDSINRYQEIPTTILGPTLRIVTSEENKVVANCKSLEDLLFKEECIGLKQFSREVQGLQQEETKVIDCFHGNGPAGPHTDKPNDHLCKKLISFYFTKFANGVGHAILSESVVDLPLGFSKISPIPQTGDVLDFKNNIKASLPDSCYEISLEEGVVDSLAENGGDCSVLNPKINEIYPIPIFLNGKPKVAKQILKIGSSVTGGEGILVTWPRYNTKFDFGGG